MICGLRAHAAVDSLLAGETVGLEINGNTKQ